MEEPKKQDILEMSIDRAIKFFNENRKPGEKKMTQVSLGRLVFIEENFTHPGWYISMWIKGKETGKMKILHLNRICNACGVSGGFILGLTKDPLFGLIKK